MKRILQVVLFFLVAGSLAAVRPPAEDEIRRPLEVWAIRSVLDHKPRMLTVALNKDLYAAYDMAKGTLYKVWKGGISMDGAPYTSKKEVQPISWGESYLSDSTQRFTWTAQRDGKPQAVQMQSKGYLFRKNQIFLTYNLILAGRDTIRIEERPEYVLSKEGKPGLERIFVTQNVPPDVKVVLKATRGNLVLVSNGRSRHVDYFDPLPDQQLAMPAKKYVHKGEQYIEQSDCLTCHETIEANVGPSFKQIATRYTKDQKTIAQLVAKVKNGGTGAWGNGLMNPHPALGISEIESIMDYIFTLKPKEKPIEKPVNRVATTPEIPTSPGFGASLGGVHPSYDLSTLSSPEFNPKVGAMAFLPHGRLLVTTWDTEGGVYLLDGLMNKKNGEVKVKRIAAGLAEPLGIEVVNGEIYVLQKQELTKLIDHDGDGVIDEYRTICNSWDVTADFHEFSFGLVYKDGYFYATLSMAMRLHTRREATTRPGTNDPDQSGRYLRIGEFWVAHAQWHWPGGGQRAICTR